MIWFKYTFLVFLTIFMIGCQLAGKARDTPEINIDSQADPVIIEQSLDRPSHWAEPSEELPGLYNFYKVDNKLYRGAQPEEEGFNTLKAMGIKTVISLRPIHSDKERCEKEGLDYYQLQIEPWEPDMDEIGEFLDIALSPEKQPAFVYSKEGAVRTGLMVAAYRIVKEGWHPEEARDEMVLGGYGFNLFWENIADYVKNIDPEALKKHLP